MPNFETFHPFLIYYLVKLNTENVPATGGCIVVCTDGGGFGSTTIKPQQNTLQLFIVGE